MGSNNLTNILLILFYHQGLNQLEQSQFLQFVHKAPSSNNENKCNDKELEKDINRAVKVASDTDESKEFEKDTNQDCVGSLYEVESLLQCKFVKNKYQFLVKWKGCKQTENTWVPRNALSGPCGELLNSYLLSCNEFNSF